jgi:hypothetical protein
VFQIGTVPVSMSPGSPFPKYRGQDGRTNFGAAVSVEVVCLLVDTSQKPPMKIDIINAVVIPLLNHRLLLAPCPALSMPSVMIITIRYAATIFTIS